MDTIKIPLEKLLAATGGSIYKVTILAAKRAIALADGEKPMIGKVSEKVLDSALQEIGAGLLKTK